MKLLVLTFILSLSTGVFAKEVKAKCNMMAESRTRESVEKQKAKKPAKGSSSSKAARSTSL